MSDLDRFSPVTRLIRLGFRSPDPGALRASYMRLMGLPAEGPDGVGAGPEPCALEFSPGQAKVLECAVYEVDDVAAARRRLQAAGVTWREEGGDLACSDVDGNRVRLRPAGPAPDPVPLRHPGPFLQHLTYTTPDTAAFAAWYERALGFRVSDWQQRNFVWLRCGAPHHVVAAVAGPTAGLDHFAFDVAGWDDLRRWADHLAARGVPLLWGPGRHGPGNNLFLFFADGDGNRVELSGDLELFYDGRAAYEPRHWPDGRWTANQWGPGPAWR